MLTGLTEFLQDISPRCDAPILEVGKRRRISIERVGFLPQLTNRDSHKTSSEYGNSQWVMFGYFRPRKSSGIAHTSYLRGTPFYRTGPRIHGWNSSSPSPNCSLFVCSPLAIVRIRSKIS